jgi:hypothetical protein
MFMIMCVIDDPDQLNAVLDSWQAAGISGVTIVESSGLHRHRRTPWIPMRYAFASTSSERGNVTLFAVVEPFEMIQKCLEATENIVGDLDEPNTGIFVALPVAAAKGVTGKRPYKQEGE